MKTKFNESMSEMSESEREKSLAKLDQLKKEVDETYLSFVRPNKPVNRFTDSKAFKGLVLIFIDEITDFKPLDRKVKDLQDFVEGLRLEIIRKKKKEENLKQLKSAGKKEFQKRQMQITKLKKEVARCQIKIAKYEHREIDLNKVDDEQSVYIKIGKLQALVRRHLDKISELEYNSAYGTVFKTRRKKFTFDGSDDAAINAAVSQFMTQRFCEEKLEPPFLSDIEEVVRKVKPDIPKVDFDQLTEHVLRKVCIQIRQIRMEELDDTLAKYESDEDDIPLAAPPEENDPELKARLQKNDEVRVASEADVLDQFLKKQLHMTPAELEADEREGQSEGSEANSEEKEGSSDDEGIEQSESSEDEKENGQSDDADDDMDDGESEAGSELANAPATPAEPETISATEVTASEAKAQTAEPEGNKTNGQSRKRSSPPSSPPEVISLDDSDDAEKGVKKMKLTGAGESVSTSTSASQAGTKRRIVGLNWQPDPVPIEVVDLCDDDD